MINQDDLRIEFKEFIIANGLKKSYVSSSLGLAPNSISCWLCGSYELSEEKQEKLKEYMLERGKR